MGSTAAAEVIAYATDAAVAAQAFAGSHNSAQTRLFASDEDALAAVKADAATFAAIAVENAASGTSHAAYDLMLKYQLVVVGEHVKDEDTATSSRYLLLTKNATAAKQPAPVDSPDSVKTSLVFAFSNGDKSGQLHRALGVFASRGISLAKIESRPWRAEAASAAGASGASFLFYADVAGHEREPRVADALAQLRELCHFIRVLGSYARNGSKVPQPATVSEKQEDDMETKYPLNPILASIPLAKSLAMYVTVKQLEAASETVYSLCVGEPDFAPPDRVIQAGIRALEQRKVQYSDMRGMAELRNIIAEYLRIAKGVTYDPDTEIQVSGGAQQPFYMALYALIRPGDKVVVPSPYWGSYEAMIKQVRAGFVKLPGKIEDDYLINPKALEETLTANPETKVFILCNPSNPAGTLLSPERLEEIATVLRKPQFRHIVVFSDEIYEQIVYQDEGQPKRVHKSFAALPGMFERTVLINGFSKAYAMTGLRIGFVAGPKHFIKPCLMLQAQLTSTANMPGQLAAVEALREELECIEQGRVRIADAGVLQELDEKRQYIAKRLRAIPNMQFAYPSAAFYLFMDLSHFFKGKKGYKADRSEVVNDVVEFCELLLREHHVAIAAGVDFGEEFGIRISYAGKMETIVRAMDGLEQTLQELTFE